MDIDNLISIDRRKNYYLIFDTETAGEQQDNGNLVKHIYDIRLLYSN